MQHQMRNEKGEAKKTIRTTTQIEEKPGEREDDEDQCQKYLCLVR